MARRFPNVLVDLGLSLLVYVLPIVTVHTFWLVGVHLLRPMRQQDADAVSWKATEWGVVLLAQLLLFLVFRLTRRRSLWLRGSAVVASLAGITVALNIALLWVIPGRYLIETNTTPERNTLVELCRVDGVDLWPSTPIADATERLVLIVRPHSGDRFAALVLPNCEPQPLGVPVTAQMLSISPGGAILWTAAMSGPASREWRVTAGDRTLSVPPEAVPAPAFPRLLDDGETLAWMERATTAGGSSQDPAPAAIVRMFGARNGVSNAVPVRGFRSGSFELVGGAGPVGPVYLSAILPPGETAGQTPRASEMQWIEIDASGAQVSAPLIVGDLARFGHSLRRVADGWVAWDTYREDGRYTIVWSRNGRPSRHELPRGLAFTSLALDARGEYVAVSATSGLSIGSQRDEVWLARTRDGAELLRRYAPKYSRAAVAIVGGRYFAVSEIADGRPAVRVWHLPR